MKLKTVIEAANTHGFTASYEEPTEKEFTTKEINGFIEYLVITTNKPISIEISPQDIETLDLYHNQSMSPGKHFLPIRIQEMSNTGERINYSSCKYLSTGPLTFRFKMPAQTSIGVKIVYA